MSEQGKTSTRGPRRWHEQQWLVDVVIRAENIDWDQPRSGYTLRPIGTDATMEFNWAKQRIRKYEDIAPTFVAAAARRERMAQEAEAYRAQLATFPRSQRAMRARDLAATLAGPMYGTATTFKGALERIAP